MYTHQKGEMGLDADREMEGKIVPRIERVGEGEKNRERWNVMQAEREGERNGF